MRECESMLWSLYGWVLRMSLVWQVMRNETAYRVDGIGRYGYHSYFLKPVLHKSANVVLGILEKVNKHNFFRF
jgi:hypothetical protein